jgi:hypothetical protein
VAAQQLHVRVVAAAGSWFWRHGGRDRIDGGGVLVWDRRGRGDWFGRKEALSRGDRMLRIDRVYMENARRIESKSSSSGNWESDKGFEVFFFETGI